MNVKTTSGSRVQGHQQCEASRMVSWDVEEDLLRWALVQLSWWRVHTVENASPDKAAEVRGVYREQIDELLVDILELLLERVLLLPQSNTVQMAWCRRTPSPRSCIVCCLVESSCHDRALSLCRVPAERIDTGHAAASKELCTVVPPLFHLLEHVTHGVS